MARALRTRALTRALDASIFASMSSTRRTRWLRLAAALVSLAAGLAIAEVACRIKLGEKFRAGSDTGTPEASFGRHDAEVGWTLLPNVSTRVVAEVFQYTLTTNSRGWRDVETPLAKPAGRRRVVVLGDSVAWGWGVDDGGSFPDLVERRVGDLELVNLAVPGYGSDQEFLTLEREGWLYEPDAVLLCVILNDVVGNASALGKPRLVRGEDGAWRMENQPVAPGSMEFAHGVQRAFRPLARHSALVRLLSTGSLAQPRLKAPVDYTYESGCEELVREGAVTREWLTRIQRACAARGVPLLAVAIAHKHDRYLYDTSFPLPAAADASPFETLFSRKLAQAGREIGFETVSVDDAMMARRKQGAMLHCGDGHLNALGNEIVADVLAPWLDARVPR